MSLPDQTPKLPKLPFIIGDLVLLGAAWYIASREAGPLGVQAMVAVTVCVVIAAIIGAVPFLTDYARKQDEALDERQRGLDALARTINTAAEQISIAANGLNELTDLTHKNLKHADQLPHKLQDKIAEFNAQLDNARENDREELEKEIAELRTSESDRLQSISEKVHKAVGELSRLEAALQQQFSTRTEQVERAHAAFSKTQADATRALHEAHAAFMRDLAAAQTKALSEIDRKLAERTAAVVNAVQSAALKPAPGESIAAAPVEAVAAPDSESTTDKMASAETGADVASPPKRPRKARREDFSPDDSQAKHSVPPTPASTNASAEEPAPPTEPFSEPAPIPVETIVQIEPVAPASKEPFPFATSQASPAAAHADQPASVETTEAASPSPAAETPLGEKPERPAQKRAPRKSAPPVLANDEPFQLASEEPSMNDDAPVTSAEVVERMISSDGATRLIATSYIGIGNRLFIRGEGPGLTWEKGIPLQFVSIGKWRWETPDASTPVLFKLYKNDDIECPGLGMLELEPGHQQEVTAKF